MSTFTVAKSRAVRSGSGLVVVLFLALFLTFLTPQFAVKAQNVSHPPLAPVTRHVGDDNKNPSEVSSKEDAASFKVNVRLVLARVVIRDGHGHTIGGLQKEDFQIFDNNKPQVISQFSMEPARAEAPPAAEPSQPGDTAPANISAVVRQTPPAPERYIAYLFDDAHLDFGNVAGVREPGLRHLATLSATDRAAVFTASGKTLLDFTDDRTQLKDAVLHIGTQPQAAETDPCPDISYYEADLIVNKNDQSALKVAVMQYQSCHPTTLMPGLLQALPSFIRGAAQRKLDEGDRQSLLSLRTLQNVVDRISRMPGQRIVILISPGFLTPQMQTYYMDAIDHAVRSQVIISTLDVRGVYVVIPGGEASKRGGIIDPSPGEPIIIDPGALKSGYEQTAATTQAEVLVALANGTGGTFFHGSNDFDEGFRHVAEIPEFSYLLGFVPQNLKPDGSFHTLKVKLKNPEKLTVQARIGYFAPNHLETSEQAKQELQEAIFLPEELHGLPLQVHTQFFKAADDAKLTVLAHVDARPLRFRSADGRHNDELTVASVLFDRNGNLVDGNQKLVTLRLKDETWRNFLANGITIKSSFDVKPGAYRVRVVVRDSGGDLSAENGEVEIP